MRFVFTAGCVAALLANTAAAIYSDRVNDPLEIVDKNEELSLDDKAYWSRLMSRQAQEGISVPTSAPTRTTPRPTTRSPTFNPSPAPSRLPSQSPSDPSDPPSQVPSTSPITSPTNPPSPSHAPSGGPSNPPSPPPSQIPSSGPSESPTSLPSAAPSNNPTVERSAIPSPSPSNRPTVVASERPSTSPSDNLTDLPTSIPSNTPSPSPSGGPSSSPSRLPSTLPSTAPSNQPTDSPTVVPSNPPSSSPSNSPSSSPSDLPSERPSTHLSASPSDNPTDLPTSLPSNPPSRSTSDSPSSSPSTLPSTLPSTAPSNQPTDSPTVVPSNSPSSSPSNSPSSGPSDLPSERPSTHLSASPNDNPTDLPLSLPSNPPSRSTSDSPSSSPSTLSSTLPSTAPSNQPTDSPTVVPSNPPSSSPSNSPSSSPSDLPSERPSTHLSASPSDNPTDLPLSLPSNPPSRSTSDSPSSSPSTLPSGRPSILPSISQTDLPSSVPSNVPSPSPSDSPSSSPSYLPSPLPTVAPSYRPSVQRSDVPSPSPSDRPIAAASDGPSEAPSLSPSEFPSLLPTVQTVLAPTIQPSELPSPGPSIPPSFIPPSDRCFVNVEVNCTPSDGSENCDSIPPLVTRCDDRPFKMVFRYNGGNCNQSFNIQPDTLFQCEDFQGGPPTVEGEQSYIIVRDIKGLGIMYHSAFVPVAGEFTVADNGNTVQANMNVTIYSSADTSPANILQTLVYHSSCSRNLFLKDRFGAVQLVIFVNEGQGVVTCFVNVTYALSIEVMGEGDNAILKSLVSLTNADTLNLTEQVRGVVVTPSSITTFTSEVALDLTVRQVYTVFTTIQGVSPQGFTCRDSHFLSFVAGNPLPPSFPVLPPSASPTITPVPTPDPELTACSLRAHVRCRVVRGTGGGDDCADLQAPSHTTCLSHSAPISLSFLYTGGSCPGTNNAAGFRCEENNGGPANLQKVHIEIRNSAKHRQVFFRGVVRLGEEVVAAGIYDKQAEIVVSSVKDGSNEPDQHYQSMRLSTSCRPAYDLALLNTFGALTLVGFQNAATGNQHIFATVRIDYVATNAGTLRATINNAVSSSGAFGGEQVLVSSPSDSIGHRDQLELGYEEVEIDLIESSGEPFDFTLHLRGANVAGGVVCADSDIVSFTVM